MGGCGSSVSLGILVQDQLHQGPFGMDQIFLGVLIHDQISTTGLRVL